jgi:hypothetical protein
MSMNFRTMTSPDMNRRSKGNPGLYAELRLVNAQIVDAITEPVLSVPIKTSSSVRCKKALWVISKLKERGVDMRILYRLIKLNLKSFEIKPPEALAFSSFKEFQHVIRHFRRLDQNSLWEHDQQPP